MSRESWIVRIDSATPARFWQGLGDIAIPADAVEPDDGAIYSGAGEIISLPDFQMLINGVAERLPAGLSGVSQEVVAMAIEEAEEVKGADMHFGRIVLDDAYQLISVTWTGLFRVDKLTTDRQNDGDDVTRSISLSIGTESTGRSNSPIALFTPADQAKRSPSDLMFNLVPSIQAGTSRRFGIKGGD